MPFMSAEGLTVHSLGEASLYLLLARCGACGGVVVPRVEDEQFAAGRLSVPAECRVCGRDDSYAFDVSRVDPTEAAGGLTGWAAMAEKGEAPPVNRSGGPSRVIDVAGWLTLHQVLSTSARARGEQAQSSSDRRLARQLHLQASQCLEEALKFYDIDNDLPPEDAFFTAAGRRQFRESPQTFLRTRLASLRAQSMTGRG